MVIKYGKYGKFLACPGYPECKNIKSYAEKIDVACPVCGGDVFVRKTKRGKAYYICSNNNKDNPNPCNFISWNKPKEGEKWTPELEETKITTRKKAKTSTKTKSTKKSKSKTGSKSKTNKK